MHIKLVHLYTENQNTRASTAGLTTAVASVFIGIVFELLEPSCVYCCCFLEFSGFRAGRTSKISKLGPVIIKNGI